MWSYLLQLCPVCWSISNVIFLFLLKQESSLVLSCEMMKWEVLEKADGQAAGVTFH